MKYTPFSSLTTERFPNTLKFARLFTSLGIIGFYISLIVAALVYFFASNNLGLSVNQTLIYGAITSFSLIGFGCLLALVILSLKPSKNSKLA